MQRRIGLMGFIFLLLMASLASAQTPAPASALAAPQSSVTASAPGAAPFCPASLFNVQSLTPTPSERVSPILCGPCSYRSSFSTCVGVPLYGGCYYLDRSGYHLAKCVPNYVCSDYSDGCDCTNAPPV